MEREERKESKGFKDLRKALVHGRLGRMVKRVRARRGKARRRSG